MILKLILLGVIQGFTEFLPISSSGHLAIAQHALNMNQNVLFITTLLHVGTIFAILTFFSKDIVTTLKSSRTLLNIFLVNTITAILAFVFKETFEFFYCSPWLIAIFLVINGFMLVITKNFKKGIKEINTPSAIIMGLTQALAITPGISRSGITITTLLLCGIKKESAFKFSFIASIPIIIAAFFYELKDTPNLNTLDFKNLVIGVIFAYISGLCALKFVKKIILLEKFYLFGYYCIVIGITALFFLIK